MSLQKKIIVLSLMILGFSCLSVYAAPTHPEQSKIVAKKEQVKVTEKKDEASAKKDEKEKTTVDNDDVYYLDESSSSQQATSATTTDETSEDQSTSAQTQPEPEPIPPLVRQKDQLSKITQNRDNPKPKKYWKNAFGVSGLINVDATDQTKPHFNHSRQDEISLTAAKLNFDVKAGSWLSGHVGLFSADESDYFYPKPANHKTTGLAVDELYATLNNFEKSPIYVRVGRQYLPFGSYHRYPIVTPLTKSLSEVRGDAAEVGFVSQNGLYATTYIFKGISEKTDSGKAHKANFGALVGYANLNHQIGFDVSMGYLNNMADVGDIRHNLTNDYYYKRVGGLNINADLMTGPFNFGYRYVSTLRRFSVLDFRWQRKPNSTRGARPRAHSFVAGYEFKTKGKDSKINVGYQWSYEAHNMNAMPGADPLQLPKNRLFLTYAIQLYSHMIVSFEYDHDHDYPVVNAGTNKFNNTATIRLTLIS